MVEFYLDTNALLDFAYEEDLFYFGYTKSELGLKNKLIYYEDHKDSPNRFVNLDQFEIDYLFGKNNNDPENEFNYIREIKDYCVITNKLLYSSYLAYYEYLNHLRKVSTIEKFLEDIPYKYIERKIDKDYQTYLDKKFKSKISENDYFFHVPVTFEEEFYHRNLGTGMGILIKVENENINLQDKDFFIFANIYMELGFTLLDIIHLRLCKMNSINYFISKDRQFDRYKNFIRKYENISIVKSFKEFYEILIGKENKLD